MKIAHISDTHIKLLKHHDTYRNIFDQLYNTLRKEKVNYIFHLGDLFHMKTVLSPEAVSLASEFLKNLADIAPVIVCAGNHDGNLKNSDRQDSITPIVESLNNKNIRFLKKSGEFVLNNEVTLNVLSIFDRDNWVKPSDWKKINIALYHGAISGCKTDTGWVMKDTDDEISIFNDHNFAMLGDIHKQQFLYPNKTVAYAGSTIQQNFGEEQDKGILIWDIKSKSNFTVKPINFINPSPFITIQYEENKLFTAPKNSFLRVILDKYYSRDEIQEIKDNLSKTLSPKSIVFVGNKFEDVKDSVEISGTKKLNLRDNNVQQTLIKEFLANKNLDDDTINAVLELNTKYNLGADITDDISRNVKWKLESLEWDNLFNYKEGNKIDFADLSGIVGIFGKNYSGKSSIVESLLYTIFNTTSKKIRKNFDIVNEKKTNGKGQAIIGINDGSLCITRETEKVSKKSKGKIVEEGKTKLDFEIVSNEANVLSLNGIDRMETDKNIRKEVGTYEDFCNTSLSTQHGSLDFINEGSTKRKEILANFLDLQIFERKYKPANQEANELKSLIKKLQVKDFIKLLDEASLKEDAAISNMSNKEKEFVLSKKLAESKKDELSKLVNELSKVEIQIDYPLLVKKRSESENKIKTDNNLIIQKEHGIKEAEDFIKKARPIIEMLNIDELKSKKLLSDSLKNEINNLLRDKNRMNENLSFHKKNAMNIISAACGTDQFNECVFKKSALESIADVDIVGMALKNLEKEKESKEKDYTKLDTQKVIEYIDKYNKINDKINESSKNILTLQKEIAELENLVLKNRNLLDIINTSIKLYEDNKESYDNAAGLFTKKVETEKQVKELIESVSFSENEKNKAIKELSAIEQMIEMYNEQYNELEKLNKEYSSYELFLECMHNNGIPFELIKSNLPLINEEMNKLLNNIVEFEAYFENEDGKLEIYIKHPESKVRSIENCSGAEKSLVAMAIRIALIKCGSLPTGDVFILDEPATSLDSEHMESFIKVLEMIKTEFKVVLLITHLDALKDSVDKIIEIQKDEEGYAFIN